MNVDHNNHYKDRVAFSLLGPVMSFVFKKYHIARANDPIHNKTNKKTTTTTITRFKNSIVSQFDTTNTMKLPLKSTASWIQQSGKNAYRILSSSTRASSPSLSLIEKQKTFLQNSTRRNYACNGGGGCGGNGSCRKQSSSGDHPDKPTHSHSFGEYTSNVQECASTGKYDHYTYDYESKH